MEPRHNSKALSEENYVMLDVTSCKLNLTLNHPIWVKEEYVS
jgi:hypothetical protein